MENDLTQQQGERLHPQVLYACASTVKNTTAVNAQPSDSVNIANLTDEELLSAINAPLTGEEVAAKIASLNEAGIDINSNTISFDEFNAYEDWRKQQQFNFWGALS